MRALLLAAACCAALSCAKTYEDLVASGEKVACPGDHLCPGTDVCVIWQGENFCKHTLPDCSLINQDCSTKYGARADFELRKRCALMQIGTGRVGAQCTEQYADGVEGTQCSVLLAGEPGNFSGVLGLTFPSEDRSCRAGLICHSLTMVPSSSTVASTDGTCRRFCRDDTDCGNPTQTSGGGALRCIDAFGKTVTTAAVDTGPDGHLGVCFPTCTLSTTSAGTGCGAGLACQVVMAVNSTTDAFGICRPAPTTSSGDADTMPCSEASPCPSPGWACVPQGTGFGCRKLCTTSPLGQCKNNQTCNTTAVKIPGNGIGLCQ